MTDPSKPAGQLVTDRNDISNILQIAKTHLWQFGFHLLDKGHDSPFTTELLRVDPDNSLLVFGPEVNALASKLPRTIRFRATSGGITIKFDAQIMADTDKPNAQLFATTCRVTFPSKLHYLQLRQAVRVNFTNLAEIPITLFSGDGHHITGRVEDISESGVKARFAGYLVEKFDKDQLIADCGLILPDHSELQGKVQVLGTLYDFQEDVSYVRCSFRQLVGNGPLRIRALINQALKKTENSASA
ncbi:MAG: hypothetical protein RLZZ385_386 [Pseudomonadota bacterium]|jgi:c-di-GMP-binding flagellar brake protein YcgR